MASRALRSVLQRQEETLRAAEVLTPRELEIVRMAGEGLRNRGIAERLSISEGTVKVHLHNIYDKLGVEGRLEMVLYAQQKGLLD
jgi:DNA-binding NarL/FixJ family response regulator